MMFFYRCDTIFIVVTFLLQMSCESISINSIVNPFSIRSGLNAKSLLSLLSKTNKVELSESKIDTDLYSRQLLVYGPSAQLRLSSSHIAVIGEGSLKSEIVKNLALAGVGKITLQRNSVTTSTTSLLVGVNNDLSDYARNINPLIQVHDLAATTTFHSVRQLKQLNVSVLVACDLPLDKLTKLDALCRSAQVKLVASSVAGRAGYVFDDLLTRHAVLDVDGEECKEVPLRDSLVVLSSLSGDKTRKKTSNDTTSMRITCIDEEVLRLTAGDKVIISLGGSGDTTKSAVVTVQQSEDQRTCVFDVPFASVGLVRRLVLSGKATAKKLKSTLHVTHLPLSTQLLRPAFNPCNACMPPKKDRALNLLLLACFKARDLLLRVKHDLPRNETAPGNSDVTLALFREVVSGELQVLVKQDAKNAAQNVLSSPQIHSAVDRFFLSAVRGEGEGEDGALQNSGCVSVVGSLAAQEVVKALTHVHMPVSQFQMFEALDSSSSSFPVSGVDEGQTVGADGLSDGGSGDELVLPSGLGGLKVFVVGAGAIGCELLKNFALMGVGAGRLGDFSKANRSSNGSLWARHGLQEGGIIVADMDSIERSNLNRQLLFRSEHIGQSKALVAAQSVRLINPAMRVHGLNTRVGPETEGLFDHRFWREVDLVLTPLDNVEARRYVDEQCVRHGKWLIDAGTLGTKGHTQVVVPFASESYSSSADPPEAAIPLCTLKSYPYQPEHCVAWARSLFEQLFSADIAALKTCLAMLSPAALPSASRVVVTDSLMDHLSSLTAEEGRRVVGLLEVVLHYSAQSGGDAREVIARWAERLFGALFEVEPRRELGEHPEGSVDEDGGAFWAGSRRLPVPLQFNASSPHHQQFVRQAARQLKRALGVVVRKGADTNGDADVDYSKNNAHSEDAVTTLHHLLADHHVTCSALQVAALRLRPQLFDKDDQTLGQADWVRLAANLRANVFSIRESSLLEVRRIAGNIMPALATTTGMVAGLAALEVEKVAREIARAKKLHRKAGDSAKVAIRSVGFIQRLLGKGAVSVATRDVPITPAPLTRAERERLLGVFRNSFVNLATPALSFSEPVPVETFSSREGGRQHTAWDTLQTPLDASTLTVEGLSLFLADTVRASSLQSISLGDDLLYADFLLQGSEGTDSVLDVRDMTVAELVIRSVVEGVLADSGGALNGEKEKVESDHEMVDYFAELMTAGMTRKQRTSCLPVLKEKIQRRLGAISVKVNGMFNGKEFLDLDVMCLDLAGEEVRMPPVRVVVKGEM